MTNCTSCGTEIPVKDIVTGNYKKIEGNTYCLPCSAKVAVQSVTPPAKAATASAGAASSSSGSKGVGNGSTATKTKTSSSSSASLQRPAGLRPAASASKPTNLSSSRSGSGIRRPPIEKDEEIDEETPRRGYVKKADPTLKIVSILGGVLLVIALVTVFVVFSRRNAEETERIARFNKSRNAISEIQRFLSDHTEDSSNDELDQLITRNAPFVIEDHTSDLNAAKNQLKDRRDIATKRKEFASLYEFLKANASSADKAEEVKNAIEKAERLIGAVGTPEQTKDFASFKVKSAVAIVESKVLKANELKEKSPDDYPAICAAFTLAEEQMSDQVQQLINTRVPGADRAKELFEQVQTEANHYADLWAESDKYGFGKATAQNLLDPKGIRQGGRVRPAMGRLPERRLQVGRRHPRREGAPSQRKRFPRGQDELGPRRQSRCPRSPDRRT